MFFYYCLSYRLKTDTRYIALLHWNRVYQGCFQFISVEYTSQLPVFFSYLLALFLSLALLKTVLLSKVFRFIQAITDSVNNGIVLNKSNFYLSLSNAFFQDEIAFCCCYCCCYCWCSEMMLIWINDSPLKATFQTNRFHLHDSNW